MDLPCPPSNQVEDGSIAALKRCACDFAYQWTTNYLEDIQDNSYDTLVIGQMIVQ
jgi:hypothetical protein